MKRTIKRIMAVLFSILMLLLCACSPDEPISSEGSANNNEFTPTGQSVSSSIFGRNTKYDAWTPAKDIVLPMDSSEIIDMVQVEKAMYLLIADGVYSFDIESNESKKAIDFDNAHKGTDIHLSLNDETLFLYFSEAETVKCYSLGGELLNEFSLSDLDGWTVSDFEATDNYFVFIRGGEEAGQGTDNQFIVFDKETLEAVSTVKAKPEVVKLYHYSEDKVLFTLNNLLNTDTGYDLYYFDVEKGKSKNIRTLSGVGNGCLYDLSYNPQTNTVLTFGNTLSRFGKLGMPVISEFSLDEDDNVTHKRFALDLSLDDNSYIGVHENIVCVLTTADNDLRWFDFLNPPESITIAYNETTKGYLTDIALAFEAEYGIMVRTTDYRNNLDLIDLKLMAGDTDFDLFCPVGYNVNKYVALGVFNELENYSTLTDKLNNSPTVATVAKYNGEYFAVPTYVGYTYQKALYPEGNTFAFSRIITLCQYCARNVDAVSQTYLDPDGEEFYKVLKFLYANPEGNEKKMPFGDEFLDENGEFAGLRSDYVMLNPASENKENALLFMEFVYDAYSGNIDGLVPANDQYMTLINPDVYFADWEHLPMSVISPLFEAYHSVLKTDGSSKEIKALAREAARQVKMRLEG